MYPASFPSSYRTGDRLINVNFWVGANAQSTCEPIHTPGIGSSSEPRRATSNPHGKNIDL